MAGQLVYAVAVTDDDGSTHWFGPGDTVPAWATRQITNPDAWQGRAAQPEDEGSEEYDAMSKADLEAEVDSRNSDRNDVDDHVVVEGKGNKPDLVAALQADDAAQSEDEGSEG